MPMVQFVEQFQPVRCISTRRAHPEPHFGVVFSQRPHGEFFHQLVQPHAAPRRHGRQPIGLDLEVKPRRPPPSSLVQPVGRPAEVRQGDVERLTLVQVGLAEVRLGLEG